MGKIHPIPIYYFLFLKTTLYCPFRRNQIKNHSPIYRAVIIIRLNNLIAGVLCKFCVLVKYSLRDRQKVHIL